MSFAIWIGKDLGIGFIRSDHGGSIMKNKITGEGWERFPTLSAFLSNERHDEKEIEENAKKPVPRRRNLLPVSDRKDDIASDSRSLSSDTRTHSPDSVERKKET